MLDCVCRARAKVCGGLWHRAWAIGQRDASGGSCESLGGVKLGSRRAGARNVFVMLALVPTRDATNVCECHVGGAARVVFPSGVQFINLAEFIIQTSNFATRTQLQNKSNRWRPTHTTTNTIPTPNN